jgi:hypothetical protein
MANNKEEDSDTEYGSAQEKLSDNESDREVEGVATAAPQVFARARNGRKNAPGLPNRKKQKKRGMFYTIV